MEPKIIHPGSSKEWREWLAKNHETPQTVWVACTKKNAPKHTLSQSEAVEQALCYGWIDGTARHLDADRFLQSFTQRKPKSVWSGINKERVRKLIADGLMTEAGLKSIEISKKNGYWSIMDDVELLKIPADLQDALKKFQDADTYFSALSPSTKKRLLQWVVLAQRPETRQKRIETIVDAAKLQQKPKQFN